MPDPIRILVVDDEEVVLLSVRKVFKGADFDMDTVQSPQLGLAMMESRRYDVVITDLMMPGMNGLEFLDKARQMDPGVRVIMITGYATMKTALQSMRRGAFDFLAKPFTKEELSTIVHRAIQHGPLEADAGSGGTVADAADAFAAGKVYTLRNHSWARLEANGMAYIGIEQDFLADMGEVKAVELPEIGETVSQGSGCSRLTGGDGRTYTLWCPLSGRVMEINPMAVSDPRRFGADGVDNWVFKIDPTSLETEIENLIP